MSHEDLLAWLEGPEATAAADLLVGPMPSPFDDVAPHPLAQACARRLQARLAAGEVSPGIPTAVLQRPEGGKMFGVLLVRAPDGRVGVLQAFSGQLDGRWVVPGWAPPLFDPSAWARLEAEADAVVKGLDERLRQAAEANLAPARAAFAAAEAQGASQAAALAALHAQRKAERRQRRAEGAPAGVDEGPWLAALDDESRRDDRERRAHKATAKGALETLGAPLRAHARRVGALERLRRLVSQAAMRRLHDTYTLRDAHGEATPLRACFAPGEPPWGAGDCAGPKLVAAANALGCRPLALAEFWWGPPPPAGGRVEGMFFPACREKCGPVLPVLLRGHPVAGRRTWSPRPVGDDELVVLHEDARVVVVVKPAGLLSVPARDARITDSVFARLRRRYPHAEGPLLVHRLDLDTSGLLLAALDPDAYRRLQAQFLARTVDKRYAAILDGVPSASEGLVDLPLRVDLEQRPRQLVDRVHGKPAQTRWRVVSSAGGRALVALQPLTGRTHQLRVHLAHAEGVGVPILGDRLYGHPERASRLYLHAERLAFTHPGTGARLELEAPSGFGEVLAALALPAPP